MTSTNQESNIASQAPEVLSQLLSNNFNASPNTNQRVSLLEALSHHLDTYIANLLFLSELSRYAHGRIIDHLNTNTRPDIEPEIEPEIELFTSTLAQEMWQQLSQASQQNDLDR
jgi:hypothetical protein